MLHHIILERTTKRIKSMRDENGSYKASVSFVIDTVLELPERKLH